MVKQITHLSELTVGDAIVVVGYDRNNFAEGELEGWFAVVGTVTACGTTAELSPGVDENSTPRMEAYWSRQPAVRYLRVGETQVDGLAMEDGNIVTDGMGAVEVQVFELENQVE